MQTHTHTYADIGPTAQMKLSDALHAVSCPKEQARVTQHSIQCSNQFPHPHVELQQVFKALIQSYIYPHYHRGCTLLLPITQIRVNLQHFTSKMRQLTTSPNLLHSAWTSGCRSSSTSPWPTMFCWTQCITG